MPQETCPDNFQVKAPSACQLVWQVPSQLNSKEGTQFKCQRNWQVPIQVPHQFIREIESSRYPRGFPRDMPSIIPVSPWFVYSNRGSSESTTENESIFGVKIQKYHADNDVLNTGSVALVINIKTGYISPQFHIVFDGGFTTTPARITNKLPHNWDNIFNKHGELPPDEFQFSIGKTMEKPDWTFRGRPQGKQQLNYWPFRVRTQGEQQLTYWPFR